MRHGESQIDAIIFDLDGLLIDSERVSKECWQKAGALVGYDVVSLYESVVGRGSTYSDAFLLSHFGVSFPVQDFRAIKDSLFEEALRRNEVPLKEGAREIVGAARISGKKIALATGSVRDVALRRLKAHQLESYFDTMVFGNEVEICKPNPALFNLAVQRLNVARENCFVVEDSNAGVAAACAAKIRVAMVVDLVPPTKETLESGARIYSTLLAVIPLIIEQ